MNDTTHSVGKFLQKFGLLIFLVIFAVTLTILSDRFLTVSNLINILRQATINGILSVGMTMVILTGGIDLSVGSVLALTVVVTADLMKKGFPVSVAMLAGILVGGLLGMLNGALVSRARIPPFIATLGMMTFARGVALAYTDGRPITGLPESFRFFGTGFIGLFPMPVIIAFVILVLGYLFLAKTRFGTYIYALGDNEVSARFAGIPTTKYITLVYVFAGFLSALAGMILIARLDSAQPTIGKGYEFDAIAAVVVGGTDLAGGKGSLLGTVLGVLIIAMLNNGLNLLNVSSFYEQVVKGIVIAMALLLHKAVR